MNYTYDETFETSAYSVLYKFNEPFSQLLYTDDFEIGIRDVYTNNVKTINKHNIALYGITSTSPVIDDRPKESLYANGGLLIYCPDQYSLYFKQLILCTDPNGAEIGFNSSVVDIWLNDREKITFNSVLFPKLNRDTAILQIDDTEEDPVLPLPNQRPEFDYELNNNHTITKNYDPGNPDALYVNTDISVPCYYSTVSAIMRTTQVSQILPSTTVSSYLYDDNAQTYIDIPYTVEGPIVEAYDLPDGLTTNVEYFKYKQLITHDGDDLYKNRLVLGFETEPAEVLPQLKRLVFNLDPTPADKILNRKTNGTLNVTITNPNSDYLSVQPTLTVIVNDEQVEPSVEFDPTNGTLSFTLTDITEGEIKITAWLDISDDPDRTQEAIKAQTQNEIVSVWTYNKIPLLPLQINDIKYYKKKQSDDNWTEVSGPTIQIDSDEEGKITATIKNPNEDYRSTDNINVDIYEHPETEPCNLTRGTYDASTGTLPITITNIKVLNSESQKTHAIQFYAYMNQETEDFDQTEVMSQTLVESPISNWIYNHIAETLNQFTITEIKYYIDSIADENEQHPVNNSIPLYNMETGIIVATLTNTNQNYINENLIGYNLIEHTEPESKCTIEPYGDYDPTTGTQKIKISNIKVSDDIKVHSSQIESYISSGTADFGPEEAKDRTKVSSNFAVWTYEQTESLTPLVISNIEYYKNNQRITPQEDSILLGFTDVGKIIATITNPNVDYIDFPIPVPTLQTHIHPEACTISIIDDSIPGQIKIQIDNIKVTSTYSTHNAQILAFLYTPTEHLSAEEVKIFTSVTSAFKTWTYIQTITLDHLIISFSDYIPAEKDDNGIHWLEFNKTTGILNTGSVKVTVHNPNEKYRDLTKYQLDIVNKFGTEDFRSNVYELYTRDTLTPINPQNITFSQLDTSSYSTTGDITFIVSNITVAREPEIAQTRVIRVYACMVSSIDDLSSEDVAVATVGTNDSELWKYKISTPDIGPDDEYRKYSLYTISDLEVNGGEIGSRDIACKNLTVNNGGIVHSNVGLADGYTFTSNGNNTFNGEISASNIVINNPATFNKPLYVTNSIFVNNITLDTVYVLPNTQITLMNGANITHILTWENPKLPEIKPITTDEVSIGTESYRGNGNIFGVNGKDGTTEYKYESITFDNSTGYDIGTEHFEDSTKHLYADFYPGKYHMDNISTVVGTQLNIHNHTSTDGNDGSVSFYIKSSALFGNNTLFNADASGVYDFRIYYEGDDQISVGVNAVNQAGTIKAPNGTVSFANNARWKGSIWAKKIILNQGAILTNDIE